MQGVVGPTGPQGEAGAQGPEGPAGESDLTWGTDSSIIYAKVAEGTPGTLDQQNPAGNQCETGATSIWQSFTAGRTGKLTGVTGTFWGSKPAVTLTIRSGEGLGGNVLFTSQVTRNIGLNSYPISGVNITAGTKYTIVYTTPGDFNQKFLCSHDVYPGGHYGNEFFDFVYDLVFQTFVGPAHGVVVSDLSQVGVGTAAPTAGVDIADGSLRLRAPASPSGNSPCSVGNIRWDPNFVCVCVATNTWRRAALLPF